MTLQGFNRASISLPALALLFLTVQPAPAQFIQQGAKLVGAGASGAAWQGESAAISADGNTAIVGGYYDNSAQGAAWVYTRSGGVWSQEGGKLTGGGAAGAAQLGSSVAVSADGNTAIVGGPYDNTRAGAVWIFTRSGGVWSQQGAKIVGTGATGANVDRGFSVSISADGNTALVGGYYDNSLTGAMWVFTRSGGVWFQQGSKIVGTGIVGAAWFGRSVSLSADGNTAIAGAPSDNGYTGAAWVFIRISGAWIQQGGKLVGSGAVGNAQQGTTVSVSGDGATAIVGGLSDGGVGDAGSTGAVWVFRRIGGSWIQEGNKLVGSGRVGYSQLAKSLAISTDANTFVVGGNFDNGATGAAWMYSREKPPVGPVTDIPDDQGGRVRLEWDRFPFDDAGNPTQITSYGIFRKIPPGLTIAGYKRLDPPAGMGAMDDSLSGYDYLMSVPALQIPSYSVVVPTLGDSSADGIPWFTYLVTGHTSNVSMYYLSGAVSGYSVDNLVPVEPVGVIGGVASGSSVELSWETPADPDIASYAIYRSGTSGFVPGPENLIGTTVSTSFTDPGPPPGARSYYRIVAIDVHGNQGPPSAEFMAEVAAALSITVDPKWNMVSVPLTVSDYSSSSLFPGATTGAFAFSGGYVDAPTLENGRGYWMKFPAGGQVPMSGLHRTGDTVAVSEGWNMIGSLSAPVPVSGIGSVPGGITTSEYYGYDGSYAIAATLEPGKGYWVKAFQAGGLILNSGGIMASTAGIRIEKTGERPPPPPDEALTGVMPGEYRLEQNYPNPFNPVTEIRYAVREEGRVQIAVYNMLGEEVRVPVDEPQGAGWKVIRFDGAGLPSGVYTYRLDVNGYSQSRKMLLLR